MTGILVFVGEALFWLLLLYGLASGELTARGIVIFVVLWLAGFIGSRYIPYQPARDMFPSFVAVLDIAMVFAIFKGDVRLT